MNFIKKLSINAQGFLGASIGKKYLVIESDDWGLVRMPSKEAFNNLKNMGIPVDTCPYNFYDSLESYEDIEVIHDFCCSFRDCNNNPLSITCNFIMANPDFDAIKKSYYQQYFYHDLNETYINHQNSTKTLEGIKLSSSHGVLVPQLHGREHLQVSHWLQALQSNDLETQIAFDNLVYGHPSKYFERTGIHFLSAFHINTKDELKFISQSIFDASRLFLETFGMYSDTFIAPRYILPSELEVDLKSAGVKLIQGTMVQLKPKIGNNSNKLIKQINWIGKKNQNSLSYNIRNVFFEPSLDGNFNWEKDAINRINTSFYWGKPAVISMHRINFMGGLSIENRNNNLERLRRLINEVQKIHKDVIFISTDQLRRELCLKSLKLSNIGQ